MNRYDRASDSFIQYPNRFQTSRRGWGTVLDIAEGVRGRLWLVTPDELMIFDPRKKKYETHRKDPYREASLNSNGLTRIMRDSSRVFWIGTNGYGLNLHDPKSSRFFLFRRPKNSFSRIKRFSITSILEDHSGYLWISADVLYQWDRHTGKLKSFEKGSEYPQAFGNTGVWSMLEDDDGYIWAAGYEGLFRYDPGTNHSRRFSHSQEELMEKVVFRVFRDRQKHIWAATENYVSRLDAKSGRFKHYLYRQNPATRSVPFTGAYQDEQSIFWFATDDGLVRFDPEEETFRYFRNDPRNPASLANNVLLTIQPDPLNSDFLWLATAGGGLNRFTISEQTFKHFTERDGLPNNVVYGVLPDEKGNLWLSTNKGLSRFTPSNGDFRNYNVWDGLQSNEFNTGAYFKSASGEMFFGGVKGLSYFHPGQIVDNPHIPHVVLTELRIFNRVVSPASDPAILGSAITETGHLTLSYKENVFSFRFAALDYSAPSRNKYAYRLLGFNDDWIPAGDNRSTTYTNLPAGDYVFQVKGSNNDGVWNEKGAVLNLHITPPPWRSWWAYTLYVLVLLGGLYGSRRYEMNRLLLKNSLRVQQIEGEELRELDQVKTRFFANISHEFRTPLTLILGQVERVAGSLQDKEEIGRLEIALRNARRLLRLINQLLDLSKLESGKMSLQAEKSDFIPLIKNLFVSFEDVAEQRQITMRFVCPFASIKFEYETDKMEKIFFNLLSNAIKYTPPGGIIELRIAVSNAENSESFPAQKRVLQVEVGDSGVGIPAEHLPHIFDRFYQVESLQTSGYEGTGGRRPAKRRIYRRGLLRK